MPIRKLLSQSVTHGSDRFSPEQVKMLKKRLNNFSVVEIKAKRFMQPYLGIVTSNQAESINNEASCTKVPFTCFWFECSN